MKLKSTFITHSTESEQLMVSVDASFSGMVRANPTAAFIIDMLLEGTTREEIIVAMLEKYDAERPIIERDVDKVLSALFRIGAIDE